MTTPEQALDGLPGIIKGLSLEQLAVAAKHEYADRLEVVVPPEGSMGAQLLRNAQVAFVSWVRGYGRWPDQIEAETEAATIWHWGVFTPGQRAQAFVDLGLFFSPWATGAADASSDSMDKVLDQLVEQLAITLASEYGPLV